MRIAGAHCASPPNIPPKRLSIPVQRCLSLVLPVTSSNLHPVKILLISRLSTILVANVRLSSKQLTNSMYTRHSAPLLTLLLGVHSDAKVTLSSPKSHLMLHSIKGTLMPFSISSPVLPRVKLKLPSRTRTSFAKRAMRPQKNSPQ